MKLEIITNKLIVVKDFIARYAVLLFVLFVAVIFGFLTLNIASFANREPTDTQIEERLSGSRGITLKDDVVQKIEALQDHNISLESLFDNGRDNPFE